MHSSSVLGTIKTVVEYILADNARNKRSFSIGVLTVFMVVTFLSLLENALSRSSVVFLRLAEDQVGAFDMLLVPDINANAPTPFINYTFVNASLQSVPSVKGAAPRWFFRGNISNAQLENNAEPVSSALVVMDSVLEESIGLAPKWPFRQLGPQEAHVSSSLLRALGVEPNKGQRILIQLNVDSLFSGSALGGIGGNSSATNSPDLARNGLISLIPRNQSITLPAGSVGQLPPIAQDFLKRNFGLRNESNSFLFNTEELVRLIKEQTLTISALCTVIDAVDETYGKYPSALGNVVILEKSFAESIIEGIFGSILANTLAPPLLGNALSRANRIIQNFDLDSYSLTTVILIANRFKTYIKDTAGRKEDLIVSSNAVINALGIDFNGQVVAVLDQALQAIDFIRIFLGEIFFTVLSVLVLLAAILIASLLLADAEEKTFEYGILRSLGLQQHYIVLILVLQSLMFSIPGVVLGLLICYLIYIPIGYFLADFSGSDFDISIDPQALILGILLGVLLPMVGVTIPIRRALTKTIRDALDVYHNVVFDTNVQVQKLSEIGLSLNETIVSIVLVVAGFLVYYLIPLSFIFGRLDMFFRVMTIILLSMVFGQLLVGQAFQAWLQHFVVMVMTFIGRDRNLSHVVKKNLQGHSARNRKTAIMFTLCLGYLIFAATMFSMQSRSLSEQIEWLYGSDVGIDAPYISLPLPEQKLIDFVKTAMVNSSAPMSMNRIVLGYSFITFPMNDYPRVVEGTLERITATASRKIRVYGIEETFLDVVNPKYVMASELNTGTFDINVLPNGAPDIVSPLYSNISDYTARSPPIVLSVRRDDGAIAAFTSLLNQTYAERIPVLISEALRNPISTTATDLLKLTIKYQNSINAEENMQYLCEPVAIVRKLPTFDTISQLRTFNTPVIMSMNWYQKLLARLESRTGLTAAAFTGSSLPKRSMLIKLLPDTGALQVEAFINQLNSLLANDDYTVKNLRAQLATTQTAAQFINLVFNILAIVGVIFSFFVLWLSFTANIRENSWELGVLRAIGLDVGSVTRIYIYEALSIIGSSIIIGTTLGIVTAITLTLQFNLFTEMPFQLDFPTFLFVLVVILSYIVAILGSYLPTVSFNRRPIAIVLRGG